MRSKKGSSRGIEPPVQFSKKKFIDLCGPSKCIDDLISASRTQDQIDFAKLLLINVKNSQDDQSKYNNLSILIHVYLESPQKHPLKNITSKLLINQKTSFVDLEPIVYKELLKLISYDESENCDRINNICNAIYSCVDTFSVEIAYNADLLMKLLTFLKFALEKHVEYLKNNLMRLSPTEKMDVYIYIHNTNRLLILLLQKYYVNGNKLDCSISWKEVVGLFVFLLSHEDLPMDSKINSCIILILLMKYEIDAEIWKHFLIYLFEDDTSEHSVLFIEMNIKKHVMVQLGVCMAVTNTLTVDELSSVIIKDTSALNYVCRCLMCLCEASSIQNTIVLGVTRTFLFISKIIFDLDRKIAVNVSDVLLHFVWHHLDYHVDSIRHLTNQILSNVVKYTAHLSLKGDTRPSTKLIDKVFNFKNNQFIYYKSLIALGSEFSCTLLLNQNPRLVENMISSINMSSDTSIVSTAFEILMTKHHSEISCDILYSTWVHPVIDRLITYESVDNHQFSFMLSVMREILLKAVKLETEIIDLMISNILHHSGEEGINNLKEGHLKCILICLNVVRKVGHFDNYKYEPYPDIKLWKGIISFELLDLAVIHHSAEINLLVFSLITDSLKTTEPFIDEEFRIVDNFFAYNINNRYPNIRQETLSITKRFLDRFFNSYMKVARNPDEINELYNTESQTEHSNELHTKFMNDYENFIKGISSKLLENIFPGANFSRRNMSMQIFLWCSDIYEKCEKFNHAIKRPIIKKDILKLLWDNLDDSYECNKQLAVQILSTPFADAFFENVSINTLIESTILKASSIKPTDCVTSAYKLELLLHRSPGTLYDKHYSIICKLLNILEKEMENANKNILIAAGMGPMYGLIYCMRHILGKTNLSTIPTNQSKIWEELVDKIINNCFDVNKIVCPIVNNSSPEGHLPMDFNAGSFHVQRNGIEIGDGKIVTAQMVLLCGWRSVKEVSLLLGDLTNNVGIIEEESLSSKEVTDNEYKSTLLTKKNLMDVGDHFITLLSETKHRGAFEQAYVGFTKLCLRLWKCYSKELHSLPTTWLNDLISAIACGDSENSKLCATRRSAGVPFIVQALVITELQVNNTPQTFEKCMRTLLSLAEQKDVTSVETRTHCLNILRALYRHTALGQYVSPFIADGLILSIEGFEGATWAERNSSTLLFSSLMTRIFGVQRTKDGDQLSIRNKMTGRIFFLRYPDLYDFLLEYLKRININDRKNIMKPSLYPILLLLSRLYPSSLEGTDSNLQLVAFVPYLTICSGSCVMKIRQLAAKATVPLIHPDQYYNHILFILTLLNKSRKNINFCHGLMLQVAKMLQCIPETIKYDKDILKQIVSCMKQSDWILNDIIKNDFPCFVLAESYLRAILFLIKGFHSAIDFTDGFFVGLGKKLSDCNRRKMYKISPGIDQFYIQSVHLNLCLLIVPQNRDKHQSIAKFVNENLRHRSYDAISTSLNYILLFYGKFDGDNFESDVEIDIVSYLNGDDSKLIIKKLHDIKSYNESISILCEQSYDYEYIEKARNVLLNIPNAICKKLDVSTVNKDDVLERFNREISDAQEKYIYIESLNEYLNDVKSLYDMFTIESINDFYNIILEISSPEGDDRDKTAVADLILNHWKIFEWMNINDNTFPNIMKNFLTVFNLLRDDNITISSKICKLGNIMSSNNIGVQTSVHLFNENKSREVLLEIFSNWMFEKDYGYGIATLIVLALGENYKNYENEEVIVFDKGETRSIEEECALTFLCMRLLKDLSDGERFKLYIKSMYETSLTEIDTFGAFLNSNKPLTSASEHVKKFNHEVLLNRPFVNDECNFNDVQESEKIENFKINAVIETVEEILRID